MPADLAEISLYMAEFCELGIRTFRTNAIRRQTCNRKHAIANMLRLKRRYITFSLSYLQYFREIALAESSLYLIYICGFG